MAGLSAENKLRDVFNPGNITALAQAIKQNWASFDEGSFLADILPRLDKLGFGERSALIRDALQKHLPDDFPEAVGILLRALGPELNGAPATFDAFIVWPQCAFVSKCGKGHFDVSMNALYEMTKRLSAEADLRTFIEVDYERAMSILHQWCDDPNPDVRRLVSEGTRPRLPLTGRIRRFQDDPRPVIALLDKLKADETDYVRRSVANNINDIAKDNPQIAVATLKRWSKHKDPRVQWVVRHAARTLIKHGEPEVLEMLGYSTAPQIAVSDVVISPTTIGRGGTIDFTFSITSCSAATQKLMVDFVVYYNKANGKPAPKVFKLRDLSLPARKAVTVRKSFALKNTSGRTIYPGWHSIEIQINGRAYRRGEFEVAA
ncbi:MAG: DNA alkylation repair protein [Chloroflexota bacterium]|nr:DNA alkylation repair protein [Chloroflexota bacterium]MDQ5866125.1 DNA alkylation repair protein [Chloroflexota bacterium]